MTYTETMVARKIGTYILTFLALIAIGLILLKKVYAVQILALIMNLIVALIMLVYFINKLIKGFHSGH